jgi:hypothetical protein
MAAGSYAPEMAQGAVLNGGSLDTADPGYHAFCPVSEALFSSPPSILGGIGDA